MPLHLRPARPDDHPTAVPLIYSSGPAAFDHVFRQGRSASAQAFLRRAFVHGGGEFGWRRHWVGEYNGRVVAVGTAFEGRDNLGNSLAALGQILRVYGLGAAPVVRRGLQVERVIAPPARGVLYLAHLGVDANCRGQGLGSQLIEHFLQRGRDAGLRTAGLDVAASNPRAQALYERLGFAVHCERASPLPGVAAHRYLQRAL
ncbi:MAG: Ribosomal-protein-alanine acetyltransferase [Stenotrophomonas maltophilia]|nr:MAG: Ribosomal-protein-alanine acetyltransferase [Stenotrophomonas maltophilia]